MFFLLILRNNVTSMSHHHPLKSRRKTFFWRTLDCWKLRNFEKELETCCIITPSSLGGKPFFDKFRIRWKFENSEKKLETCHIITPSSLGGKHVFDNFQTIFIKLATNQQIAPLAFKPETIWVRTGTISFSLLARNFSLLSFLGITCWLCWFIRWISHLFLSAASIWPSTIPFFFSSQAELDFEQTFFFYEEIKKKTQVVWWVHSSFFCAATQLKKKDSNFSLCFQNQKVHKHLRKRFCSCVFLKRAFFLSPLSCMKKKVSS